jgi:hypothetical protein
MCLSYVVYTYGRVVHLPPCRNLSGEDLFRILCCACFITISSRLSGASSSYRWVIIPLGLSVAVVD